MDKPHARTLMDKPNARALPRSKSLEALELLQIHARQASPSLSTQCSGNHSMQPRTHQFQQHLHVLRVITGVCTMNGHKVGTAMG